MSHWRQRRSFCQGNVEQAFTGKEPGGDVVVHAQSQLDEAEGEEEDLWNKLSMVLPPRKHKRQAVTVDDGEHRIDDEENSNRGEEMDSATPDGS